MIIILIIKLSPPVLSFIVDFITLSVSFFSIGSMATENKNNNNVCILGSDVLYTLVIVRPSLI